MKKVLIIDDSQLQRESAETQRPLFHESGYDITILGENTQQAYDEIVKNSSNYDIGLFDLWIPGGNWISEMGDKDDSRSALPASKKPDLFPFGLSFALKFLQLGKQVGILTDSDHHTDWYCSMLDPISSFDSEFNGTSQVIYCEARCFCYKVNDEWRVNGHLVKDWHSVLLRLTNGQ
jgi:hypothetical protein